MAVRVVGFVCLVLVLVLALPLALASSFLVLASLAVVSALLALYWMVCFMGGLV